jgi:integrase/recombinase XerC
MPLLDLGKITLGLSKTWSGSLRDWDRSLRAGNYPETTRYNYLLAAAQLARYLGSTRPTPRPTLRLMTRPRSAVRMWRRSRRG